MKHAFLTIALLLITGCSASLPPLKTVDNVDIKALHGALVRHRLHPDLHRDRCL